MTGKTKISNAEKATRWPYVVDGRPVVKIWFDPDDPAEFCRFFTPVTQDREESRRAIEELVESKTLDRDVFVDVTGKVSEMQMEDLDQVEEGFQDDIDTGRAAGLLGTRDF